MRKMPCRPAKRSGQLNDSILNITVTFCVCIASAISRGEPSSPPHSHPTPYCTVVLVQLVEKPKFSLDTVADAVRRANSVAKGLFIPPEAYLEPAHWLFGSGYNRKTDKILLDSHSPEHLPFAIVHERMHQINEHNLRREENRHLKQFVAEVNAAMKLKQEIRSIQNDIELVKGAANKKERARLRAKLRRLEDKHSKNLRALEQREQLWESVDELISNTAAVIASGNPKVEAELLKESFQWNSDLKTFNLPFRDFEKEWDLRTYNSDALTPPEYFLTTPSSRYDTHNVFGPTKNYLWVNSIKDKTPEQREAIIANLYHQSVSLVAEEFAKIEESPNDYRFNPSDLNARLIEKLRLHRE